MFLPKKIKVGYNERSDTYSGKLSYIIYYDEKDKLRKEASWDSWRDIKLGSDDFTNDPTEGFVLNKKAGGQRCSWNTRATYTRVYDPRGFEFEISIPNLLFILENVNSYKGKALGGSFVYGWEGTELWLIPVDAPEYSEWTNTSKILLTNTTIKAKDLVVGYTYMTKQEQEWIYLGRFIEYDNDRQREDKPMLKKHWFVDVKQTESGADKDRSSWYKNYYESFDSLSVDTITSVPQKIVYCLSEEVHPEYPEIMEALEHRSGFIGLEETSKVFPYTYEEFMREIGVDYCFRYGEEFYTSDGTSFHIRKHRDEVFERYVKKKKYNNNNRWGTNFWDWENTVIKTYNSINEVFAEGDLHYKNDYLSNGKITRTSRGYDISLKEIIKEENRNE